MGDCAIVISDLHIGSTVAPWPADQSLQDGALITPNPFQVYLNDCWADLLQAARLIKPRVLVINGDVIQGCNTHKDGQLVTYSPAIQAQAAERLLEPLVEYCERLYITRGTEFHDGRCSEHVEQLAARLGATPMPTGQYTWPDLFLELGGRTIHFAHHIGVSGVPGYEATAPLRDALTLLTECHRNWGELGPRVELMVRSHRHRYVHVDSPGLVQAVVCPAWQLKGSYGYKVAPNTWCHIGWVLVEATERGLKVDRTLYPGPAPTVQRVEVA